MSGIFAELLTMAKKIDNYAEDATAGGLWVTTNAYKVVVPAGKRWFLLGGHVDRTVSATLSVQIFNSSDKPLQTLAVMSAATGKTVYPSQASGTSHPNYSMPIIMDAGDYIQCYLGAAQNASAYASCVVLEIDV